MIDGAKLVGGVWLPAGEEHLLEVMGPGGKQHRVIDGRWTYQYHKIERAMRHTAIRRACIDIGAHVGLWSVHLRQMFDRVWAFEPVPLHARCFRANVPLSDNVFLIECALGETEKEVAMHVPEDTTGNSHIATDEPISTGYGPIDSVKHIDVWPLDYFKLRSIDFVKIDVEGYELPVVKGARETLLSNKPTVVIEQKGNDARFYGDRRNAALEFLGSLGMKRLDVISGDYILGW